MIGGIGKAELDHLLASYGYWAIVLAVVADSFGLPVPGEVMLLLASIYAGATHHLALPLIIAAAAAGAIAGDNVTFSLGRFGGYPLLHRYGRFIRVDRRRRRIGQYLFQRYGGRVVSAGRFIPVLHIWTAILAGVNRMPWHRFVVYNALGAVVWASCLSGTGYLLGAAALRFWSLIAGAAFPLAAIIVVLVLIALRRNEKRLEREAERAMNGQGKRGA